jgi:hypothetical protein
MYEPRLSPFEKCMLLLLGFIALAICGADERGKRIVHAVFSIINMRGWEVDERGARYLEDACFSEPIEYLGPPKMGEKVLGKRPRKS